jgi:hypothetical protein
MSTGQMTAFEEAGQVQGETYQLSSEKLSELQSIMQGSEVCEPILEAAHFEGRVCTMAYRYPYAVLFEKGLEIRLGEKNDGCDVAVDLCGAKADKLKAWTKSVVESL